MSFLPVLLTFVVLASAYPAIEKNPEEAGYYQGDIRLVDDQLIQGGIIGDRYRWPDAIVPITIDSEFTAAERDLVQSGLDDIAAKTCIRFVTRTTELNYVFIDRGLPGSGCWSYVGNTQRGRQEVNLMPSSPGYGTCITKGIAAHEMIHAIGFYHEQSRIDRDSYVQINYSNIQEAYVYAFDIETNTYDQGVAYDYDSLMHYGAYSFAINPSEPTIFAPVPIGQRLALSEKDAQKIRNMYKC